MIVDGKKYCPGCKKTQPVEEFGTHNRKSDGLQSYCKSCANEYSRKYHENNRTRVQERDREVKRKMRKERPEVIMWAAARRRARKRGQPCTITPDDIASVLTGVCAIFGTPTCRNVGDKGGPTDDSPTLDCIVPELGYVPGNIQELSHLANKMKSNATPAQLLSFADWAYKTHGNEGIQ